MNLNIIYIINIFLGFIIPFFVSYIFNQKRKLIKTEYLIYCYFIFILCFIVFSKLLYSITNFQLHKIISFLFENDITEKIQFILSGYSFIGGYIGSLLGLAIFLRQINNNKEPILFLFSLNLLLMNSVLKIGCYIKGCCYSTYLPIPIQLVECFFTFLSFILVIYLEKKNYTALFLIGFSILSFSIIRFTVAFFRYFSTNLGFILNQIICILLFIIGILLIRRSQNTFLRKICHTNS